MNIARIAGVALMAGLALFLISILAKMLIIGAVAFLIVRVIGKQIARRFYGHGPLGQGQGQGRWQSAGIISIDNPSYRVSAYQSATFDRIVPIN
ncbi:MAG: hypothetical protein LH609_07805 [Rudanella sp.]|nr:hypothetical protein [Rudanella sp.]